MKVCIKCNILQDDDNFYKHFDKRVNKNRLDSVCKSCYKKKYEDNIEDYKEYAEKNKDRIKEYLKNYSKEYRKENKDKLRINSNLYNKSEKRKQYIKEYNEKNKEKLREKRNKYRNERRKNDILFIIEERVRNTIRKQFMKIGYKKSKRTSVILDCSFECFKKYIEGQFEPWMNWDNYGKYNGELNYGWDLDHIIPISSAKNEEQIYKLNHYTNFQPLCSKINRDIKKANY